MVSTTAITPASTKPTTLVCEIVTMLFMVCQVPSPLSSVRTSEPNSVFISCWNRIDRPKVARIEVNRSRSTIRKMIVW